jgi:hypothetical protein
MLNFFYTSRTGLPEIQTPRLDIGIWVDSAEQFRRISSSYHLHIYLVLIFGIYLHISIKLFLTMLSIQTASVV